MFLALVAPAYASAASLTGEARGSLIAQGMDVGVDIDVGAGATGTPSQGSAGDDAVIGVSPMRVLDVSTDADLDRYETSLRGEDQYFVDATMEAQGKVEVAYYHDGRLFGIIPVKVKSHTEVSTNDEGQVVVVTRLPWWSAFVTGTGTVASSVDEDLAASGTLATDLKLEGNAAAKARILEAVANAHARARVSAAGE